MAGLAAAYELRKLGFDITVLEALQDRVGGRVYTYYFDRQRKLYNEFGPMRIPVTHETVWHYIKTFDLPARPFIQYNPNGFVYLKNARVRNDPDGAGVARYIYPKYPLTDWVEENYPAALTYLYEIPGGMARLPLAFHASFANSCPYPGMRGEDLGKVRYRAGCLVNGIFLESSGVKVGIRYQNHKTCDNIVEYFDYVICAIPFSTLRNIVIDPLFSGIKMRAIREVNYTPAQKSLLLLRERFWERDWIAGGGSYTDLPYRRGLQNCQLG